MIKRHLKYIFTGVGHPVLSLGFILKRSISPLKIYFKCLTFISGFFFLLVEVAFTVEIKLPQPEIETLPNGLKVVWFVSSKLPVIDLSLLVKSGFRHDPVGKSGTAELLALTLDRGAGGLSAEQIARTVDRLGASRYSSTDEDTFSVGIHGLSLDASVLLDLLGKMILQPEFSEIEIKKEHARLLDRWSHIGDNSETLAALAYQRLVAAGTAYGRGNFSSIKEFKKVGQKEVIDFYRHHFTPKNSILMVVGKVDRTLFRKQIDSIFGEWRGEEPSRTKFTFSDSRLKSKKGEIVLVERPNQSQAQIRLGFKAPLINVPEHYSLTIANTLLGEYFNSRLNSVIRDQLGLTYSISSSFSYSKDFATFGIGSATRNEAVGQVIQKMLEILRVLKKIGVKEEEVELAKDYLIGGYPLGVSTLYGVASRWLTGTIFDLGPDFLNEFVPKVSAQKGAEVWGAVKKYFELENIKIVVAGDSKEIFASLKKSGLTRVKVVGVKDLI